MELRTPIPDQILEANNVIILTLAVQNDNIRKSTVIILEIIREDTAEVELTFEKPYYVGSYDELLGLNFTDEIRVNDDRFDTVSFDLQGDDAQWFELLRKENSVELILKDSIPTNVLLNTNQLIFEVMANTPTSIIRSARATIIITLTDRESLKKYFNQLSH